MKQLLSLSTPIPFIVRVWSPRECGKTTYSTRGISHLQWLRRSVSLFPSLQVCFFSLLVIRSSFSRCSSNFLRLQPCVISHIALLPSSIVLLVISVIMLCSPFVLAKHCLTAVNSNVSRINSSRALLGEPFARDTFLLFLRLTICANQYSVPREIACDFALFTCYSCSFPKRSIWAIAPSNLRALLNI